MAKPPSSKASRLSTEERQLEQMRADILRQQQELEKKLKRLPVQLAAQEEEKRVQAHKRAASAGPAISSRMGRGGRSGKGRNKTLRMPSRERRSAQIKTIAFVIILAIIVFFLLNVIPKG